MCIPRFFYLFLAMAFLCSTHIATAQSDASFENISTAQGLSQGLINDMIQDREGFIWIATKGGLNRYDGYSFKIFTTNPQDTNSISSNAISNLLEDSRGRIWIGTYDGGINVYDKNTGRFLRMVQNSGNTAGLANNRIESAMIELPDGRILACPQDGNMCLIALPNGINPQPVITPVHAPDNKQVHGIGKDDKGFIWVGCTDNSIYIYFPSSAKFALLSNGQTFTPLIEKTGTQLTARSSQVFFLKPDPKKELTLFDAGRRVLPEAFSFEADGSIKIRQVFTLKAGASGNNFYDFSNLRGGSSIEDAATYYIKTPIRDQTIKCFLLDRSGILWVGMLGHGIYKYRIGSYRFLPVMPGLSIQRITVLRNDTIYVQGWSTAKTITAKGIECGNLLHTVLQHRSSSAILHAKNGDYWAYAMEEKKLFRYSANLQLLQSYPEPVNAIPTEQIQPILEDSRHRIWVCGTNGTLACVNPANGQYSKFIIDMGHLAGTAALVQTNAFFEDKKGAFWLGTEHGFAKLVFTDNMAAPAVKWYKNIPGSSNSLSYNYVSWFMDDPANADYLWICTKGGGLNRMQKSTGNFIHYSKKEGLPNDVVYGILTDNAGNIWGSTNRGLFCLLANKTAPAGPPLIRSFSTSDGLQADEFNTNALGKLANGNLVFGGVNGINIFNPQQVLAASYKPRVFITGIQIGNTNISPGDYTGILKNNIEKTSAISLTHLQDVLTLEFSSLDYTAPQQNQYRYQLEGIDKGWVQSGTRRNVTYLHLPAGKYNFKVQGSNSQGIWSDAIATLAINMLPPWWRSWWAYTLYGLIVALGISTYLRFKVRQAGLQSQLRYEQLEAKRIKELDTIKTQLYTNITHEFRTPLTVILGMAQQVADKPAEQFKSRMEMIVRNGRNLLNLVNQLLDLSKLENGKMELQLSHGDIIHFLRYVVESFHSLAETQQKQLHFLTDVDSLYGTYDSEKLRQLVSNLLSNAIKFTPEKGNIYITVHEKHNPDKTDGYNLIIKVKDTGIGIPEDQLQFVFDRFYRLDNSHTRNAEGTGIGLALTKELVKLMEGEITVKSPPAGALKGTEFTVSLPMNAIPAAGGDPGIETKKQAVPTATTTAQASLPTVLLNDTTAKNTPLILMVEDNADVVAYTASCLPDYRLIVGKDGREGLEIASDMIPDLIISDVMMPHMDGFELTSKLRQDENTSHIPIILLTAKADIGSKIEGLQYGADAYLEKPFNKEELLVRIKKLLELRKSLQQYYLKKAGIPENTITNALQQPAPIPEPAREDSFVKKVREAVEENLTDPDFTVEQLSRLVFLSHSQLHRKLEALTGYSPNKFIRTIRLTKAKILLLDSANSIAAVALDCGYQDPGYFARVFKQEYGITPQEWRTAQK